MITDASSKFDDYSISPKIKQILLHWDYELTEKYFSFIRQIMQTVKKDILKKKLLSINQKTKRNKEKSQGIDTKTCQKKKKTRLYSMKEKDYQQLFQYKKEALQNK